MLHAIVCEVNYATRAGETVVKNLLCDTNTPKGKTWLLIQLIKIRNCLTNPKEYGILTKKSNEQAFDFIALKTAQGRRFESRHQLKKSVRENRADFFVQVCH